MEALNEKLLKSNIEKRAKEDIEKQNISGAAVAVMQAGKTLYKGCFGAIKENTVFRLASMTKPITTAAAMLLMEKVLLNLDDPVCKYIPEFENMHIASLSNDGVIEKLGQAVNEITVLNLLNHTSGLGCEQLGVTQNAAMTAKDRETLENTVGYYSAQGLAFEPGDREAYSPTAGFEVLTLIIQRITGKSLGEFLKENIFILCNMRDTTFNPSSEQWARVATMHDIKNGKSCVGHTEAGCVFEAFPVTHCVGGAGLVSTLNDYSNFAQMLLNKGSFNGNRVLSEESVKLISTPHVSAKIQTGSERWGLGVRVITGENTLPVGAYGWSGAYGTHFWIDPENEITAVYMKNSRYDGGAAAVTAANFEKDVYMSLV